jgi:hypothetical protein
MIEWMNLLMHILSSEYLKIPDKIPAVEEKKRGHRSDVSGLGT